MSGTQAGIQQFDFSVNVLQTLLWQDQPAKKLQTLLQDKQDWYQENNTVFWNQWFVDVFNLISANDFGLAVWSIILDQPIRLAPPPDPPDVPIFGYDFEPPHVNFDRGFFSNTGENPALSTEEKRVLLRLKYIKCISGCDIPSTNQYLANIFASFGPVYMTDGLDMTVTVTFGFTPLRRFLNALRKFDLFPHATGVKVIYVVP